MTPIETVQAWAAKNQGKFYISGGRVEACLTEDELLEFAEFVLAAGPHGGYTCVEIEAIQDDLIGALNGISEVLLRRGHKVNLKEHDIYHWVAEALKRGRS